MDSNRNIRFVKLLMRMLETNSPYNQSYVSIGFQNQSETKKKTEAKPSCKKLTFK